MTMTTDTTTSSTSAENDDDLDFIMRHVPQPTSLEGTSANVDIDGTHIAALSGAWGALAKANPECLTTVKSFLGSLPPKFASLTTPEKD